MEKDRGALGKGPKLFELHQGALEGWHHDDEVATRREHLRKAAEKDGWLTVFHRLDALSKITKKTQPSVSEAARSDANYARVHLEHKYVD